MKLDIFKASTLITKQQAISFGLFNDSKSSKTSKYWKLYEAITDGKVNDDTSAMSLLGYSNKRNYNRFRDRYTHKLLNSLLIDEVRIPTRDSHRDEYFKMLKLYSAAKIFHYFHQKKNSIALYKYVYSKARKNALLDLQIFSLIELKKHYAFVEPNPKLYQEYQKMLDKSMRDLTRTMEIDKHYDDISHKNIINSLSKKHDFQKESILIAEELINNLSDEELFENQNKIYEIASFAYNINGRYQDAIDISKASIELTQKNRKEITFQLVGAYRDILTSYLKLKDYEQAKIYLDKIMQLTRIHGHNYFRNKALEYSLYVVTKDYDAMYEVTVKTMADKKLKNYTIQVEEWQIRQAFVNIFVEAGKISEHLHIGTKWNFKLSKFINQVEFYSKDKRGTNISVQVIQLIHFLIHRQYDKVVERLDALNQYTYRYLRNDETLRSNCFIKMLLKLPEAEYHPVRTERYVAKYKKKLDENPYDLSMKEIAVEIVPYEDLWNIIIEILGTNLSKG